jgi:tripartite-type tricarboxylate transporter receptor subunit TctC
MPNGCAVCVRGAPRNDNVESIGVLPHWVICGALALAGSATAAAQDYPNRPIRYIVPQAPGGSSDTLARMITQRVADGLGQPLIVDNRPGATGIIGAEVVAKANPDGHTLLQAATSHATNPAMQAKLPYDSVRDFAPISLLSQQPNIWIVNPSLPVKNMKELIAYVKGKPGQLNFGSSGTGGSQHLAGELLKSMAGIDMLHIPYKGSPPALLDLLAGRIPIMSSTMPPVLPHLRSGKVRALAVTSAKRSPALPELPTVAESAVPGYEAIAWQGLLAPAGTPRAVVSRIQSEFARVLKQPEITARLAEQGYETVASTPEWFAAYIKTEIAKWSKVIKAAGIKGGEG